MKQRGKKTIVCVLLCVLVCMVSAFALAGCKKTEAPKKYSVIFMNGDTQISEQTVEANKEAVKPADPTKESSVSTVYTFAGWALTADGEVVTDFTIKADTTFYAVYTPSARKYNVKFMDGDTQLSSADVDYDTQATKPADPTKESSVSTVYTFAGWALTADGEIVTDFTIKADTTFYAVYTPSTRKYNVKFMNGDTQVSSADVDYDAQATKPADPTKAADVKYTYTFAGWALSADGDVVTDFKVTGDVTYYAVYTSVVNKYDVKFMLDGEQIGATQNIDYDTAPTMPEAPTKAATAEYTYTFAGWYTAAEGGEKVEDFTVKGNATYYGRFTATKNRYEIKFVDGDGKQVEGTQTVEYGTAATAPATATKAATDKYTYAFEGWYTAAEGGEKVTDFTVKANATYYAHFTSTVNKYEVKFMLDGEQVGDTQNIDYDTAPTMPEAPTKAATAEYTYTFAGWYTAAEGGEKVEDFTVKGNATYYGRFTAVKNKYTVKFIDGNGEEMTENAQTLDYGSEIELPVEPTAESGYYFAGWKTEGGKFWQESDVLEKNETLTATFEVYKGVVFDDCVLKDTDRSENTDFIQSNEPKAKGFENVYTKSITSDLTLYYSHHNISYYNVVRFAIKTNALYRFNNFGATDDPRVYMDEYTDWTYWTLTKIEDKKWNIKIAFGDKIVYDYTHSDCPDNSVCHVLYHGVPKYDFMIFSYDYSKTYTVACTEIRVGEASVIDTVSVDTTIGCPINSSVGFTESSGMTAPGYTKKYVKEVTGNFQEKYSYDDISAYSEIRFAMRAIGTDVYYQFDNFGPAADARSYTTVFGGWTYWILTQTADKEWNVKVICGDTEVFNATHSSCGDNAISWILYHGTSHGFTIYPNDTSASYTVECTEVRGILKAEA